MRKNYSIVFNNILVGRTTNLTAACNVAIEASIAAIWRNLPTSGLQGKALRNAFAENRAAVMANVVSLAGQVQVLQTTAVGLPPKLIALKPKELQAAFRNHEQKLGLQLLGGILEVSLTGESRTAWEFQLSELPTLSNAICCEFRDVTVSQLIDRAREAGLATQVGEHKYVVADGNVLVIENYPPLEVDIGDVWEAKRYGACSPYDEVLAIHKSWTQEEMSKALDWWHTGWKARLL